MFKEIFFFEIKYRIKRPATWAYFGILLVFGLIIAIGGNGPASEKVFVNSPVAIASMLSTVSIFGIMIASAIMGVPVYRDIEHKTENYYFTYPISEKGYILGRFFGSLSILFLVSLGLQLGLIIGFIIGHIRYMHHGQFTCTKQLGQFAGIPRIGLDPLAGTHGGERRRHHAHLVALSDQVAGQGEPTRSGLIAEADFLPGHFVLLKKPAQHQFHPVDVG